jgi:hypothetical protein
MSAEGIEELSRSGSLDQTRPNDQMLALRFDN